MELEKGAVRDQVGVRDQVLEALRAKDYERAARLIVEVVDGHATCGRGGGGEAGAGVSGGR